MTVSSRPDTISLAERFRLVERGRERGKNNMPPPTQPGLDLVETEVVDHCSRLFGEKKDAYRRAVRLSEERIVSPASATDPEAAVEEACDRMKARVDEERPELKRLHRSAQKAIDELRTFKDEQGLSRDASVPKSLVTSAAILAALLVVETVANGLFFGANLAGGLIGGVSYAVLISVINVGVFGLLAASAVRQVHHRDQSRQVVGYLGLLLVVAAAVAWNLAVAHYREALPADYPPSPEVVGEVAASADASECWEGPSEADADGEAICLLWSNWFSLNGFLSYMLMLIGLLMCGVAAWKWLGMSDRYPGFGQLERRCRETEKRLLDERQELLAKLDADLKSAVTKQHSIFKDPADAWTRAVKAFGDLKQGHEELRDFARDLEEECRSALETYRSANREAPRNEAEPAFWSKPWTASWELPDAPSEGERESRDRHEAKARSEAARDERDQRLAKLRRCAEERKVEVEQITRISYE